MKKRILIVSENQEFQELLESFLSRYYDVKTSVSITDTLGLIETGFKPHLIVEDSLLPSSESKVFISTIKSIPSLIHTPIIILSGNEKSADKKELIMAGASDYLKKPFSLNELESRINNVLEINSRLYL